jgi:hypothetical protein
MKNLIQLLMFIIMLSMSRLAFADDPKVITSATCEDIKFEDIPVGDFKPPMTMPESVMRITQTYNQSKADGYCEVGNTQPPASSDACQGKLIKYGHDGIDIHELGATAGQNSVYATQTAIIIASHKVGTAKGWGESMFLAVRANKFSDQIIVLHSHHLDQTGKGESYQTTRRFNACELVNRGDELAKEGKSGTGAVHLHYTVHRFNNFKELQAALKNNGANLYTSGYAYGNQAKLAPLLHPWEMLYDEYLDFHADQGQPIPDAWAYPYALDMRHHGIEFGLYDGSYGRLQNVTRAEAARWIKIATDRPDSVPTQSTFPDDLTLNNKDSPYIEALTKFPKSVPVVNPTATCETGKKKFCPDANLKRAEALKMIVLAFYDQQFLKIYENQIWKNSYVAAMALLTSYQDVDALSWYAPYVYFGTSLGLVTDQQFFRPTDPVTRAEMAKWVMIGYNLKHDTNQNPCSSVNCQQGYYCDQQTHTCKQVSECVPTETTTCEVGGGYDPCEEDPMCGGVCVPGNTTSCGNCGTKTCDGNGEWSACTNQGSCTPGYIWSETCNTSGTRTRLCENTCEPGAWSACSVQPAECIPGYVKIGSCPNDESKNMQCTCQPNGMWGPWTSCDDTPTPACTAGQTQQQNCGVNGTQNRVCNQSGQWGTWDSCIEQQNCTCSTGECCDGCNYSNNSVSCDLWYNYQCAGNNPGDNAQKAMVKQFCSGNSANCTGAIQQYGWQTQEDCSSNQVCIMQGGVSTCSTESCQDTFDKSAASACYTNSQSAGSPTLCIEVKKVSGADFQYRACKQSGTFSNNFSYRLKDDNNSVSFTSYNGSSGSSCTGWKDFNVNYISGYGAVNGAGIYAEVISPQGCAQSDCKYRTGTVTITKTCQ